MNPKPEFSVIIPTFNRAKILVRAIGSVLNQSLQNFELFIIDDGSTDGTKAVVESIYDPRVRYLYQEASGGPASPRNRGIAEAQSEWICFLDSDDLWFPNKLAKVRESIRKTPNASVFCHDLVEQDTAERRGRLMKAGLQNSNSYAEMLVNGIQIFNSAATVSKSFLARNSIQVNDCKDFVSCEDYDLWLQCARYGARFVIVNEVLGVYWREMDSLTIDGELHSRRYQKLLWHHCFEIQTFTSRKWMLYWRVSAQLKLRRASICFKQGFYLRMLSALISCTLRNPNVLINFLRMRRLQKISSSKSDFENTLTISAFRSSC